jgi:SPX domain protein involved in polyphosphate accumulation
VGKSGEYLIRSVYFDTPSDRALVDKISGISEREKFRIRFYNMDTNYIRLERKYKRNQLGNKASAPLTLAQAQDIVTGNLAWMLASESALIRELYAKMKNTLLTPKVIVDYMREPFLFPAGNIRITLDREIRSGTDVTNAFTMKTVTIPIKENVILMEVKYDEFLPDIIKHLIQIDNQRSGAYSKYATCRLNAY